MAKKVSLTTEIANLDELLKKYGYLMPELQHIDNPNTLDILIHPYTKKLLKEFPGFRKLLADLHVKERIHRLSGMDAAEKLIDLGLSGFGKEASIKLRKKRGEDGG